MLIFSNCSPAGHKLFGTLNNFYCMQRVLRPECLRRTTTHSLFLSTHTVFLSLESSHISGIADRQSNFYFTKKTDGWKTRTCCHICIFGRTHIIQLCMAEHTLFYLLKVTGTYIFSQVWWCVPRIPALQRLERGTRSCQSSLVTEQVLDQPGLS